MLLTESVTTGVPDWSAALVLLMVPVLLVLQRVVVTFDEDAALRQDQSQVETSPDCTMETHCQPFARWRSSSDPTSSFTLNEDICCGCAGGGGGACAGACVCCVEACCAGG